MWSSVLGFRLCWPWGRGSFYGLILHKAHNNLSVHSPARPLHTMQATAQAHTPSLHQHPHPFHHPDSNLKVWVAVPLKGESLLLSYFYLQNVMDPPASPLSLHNDPCHCRTGPPLELHAWCLLMPTFSDCKEHPHDRGWFWSTLWECLLWYIFKLGCGEKKDHICIFKENIWSALLFISICISCLICAKS